MIVDPKVHVEIVHYKGRQGSNMWPRERLMQGLWKIRESSCEEWLFADKRI